MHGRIRETGKPINHNHFQSISKAEKKKRRTRQSATKAIFSPQIRTVPMQ